VGTESENPDLKSYRLCGTPTAVSMVKPDRTGKAHVKGGGMSEGP